MGRKFNESMIRIFKDGWRMDIINPPFGMTSGVIPCFKNPCHDELPIKAITEGKQLEKIKSNRDFKNNNNTTTSAYPFHIMLSNCCKTLCSGVNSHAQKFSQAE
ncbi:hypothetical protein CEXT_645511 [Caerostris extrusa]|uniref:Uncharacterized protein n=1 Tax=Caerostris extrusa TaxID=172846 RepID=A0AAV4XFQ1_CAEEX|nr:hypothetical protein CEXT_645511 [Caerostris extrusa]